MQAFHSTRPLASPKVARCIHGTRAKDCKDPLALRHRYDPAAAYGLACSQCTESIPAVNHPQDVFHAFASQASWQRAWIDGDGAKLSVVSYEETIACVRTDREPARVLAVRPVNLSAQQLNQFMVPMVTDVDITRVTWKVDTTGTRYSKQTNLCAYLLLRTNIEG